MWDYSNIVLFVTKFKSLGHFSSLMRTQRKHQCMKAIKIPQVYFPPQVQIPLKILFSYSLQLYTNIVVTSKSLNRFPTQKVHYKSFTIQYTHLYKHFLKIFFQRKSKLGMEIAIEHPIIEQQKETKQKIHFHTFDFDLIRFWLSCGVLSSSRLLHLLMCLMMASLGSSPL